MRLKRELSWSFSRPRETVLCGLHPDRHPARQHRAGAGIVGSGGGREDELEQGRPDSRRSDRQCHRVKLDGSVTVVPTIKGSTATFSFSALKPGAHVLTARSRTPPG